MTQKPEKRQTGYTYALRSYQTDDIYIGSTLGTLRQRLYKHKQNLKQFNNGKYHYVTSYEIVKYDDAFIEMIDKYENVNKIELRKYEGQTIRNTKCVNKNIPCRTFKEYRETNKDKIKEQQKQYYETHKEEMKQYYETNKDKIKEYKLINKDKIKEQKKEYYLLMKQKLKTTIFGEMVLN